MNKKQFQKLLNGKHEAHNPYFVEGETLHAKRTPTYKKALLVCSPIFAAALAVAIIVPIALNASEPLRRYKLNAPQKPFNSESVPAVSSSLVNAIQGFAADYGRQVYSTEANPVFSPASIVSAFSMLKDGAEGSSKQELDQMLRGGANKEEMRNLLLADAIDKNESSKTCYLNLSQAIFIDESYKKFVKESYLDLLTDYYYSEAFSGDLATSEMRDLLAEWINEKTADFLNVKGEDFKEPQGTSSLFWLINTIYLKSDWGQKTKPHGNQAFHNADGTEKSVESFILQGGISYTDSPRYTTASTALDGGMRFSLLLPKEKESIESTLSALESYEALFEEAADTTAEYACVVMPSFKAHEKYDLKEALAPLGVSSIFDERNADLSGIIGNDPNGGKVFIAKAVHETGIEVSPQGIKAAAYTAASGGWMSAPCKWIHVNRPFLYTITDKQDVPLFVGAVNNL